MVYVPNCQGQIARSRRRVQILVLPRAIVILWKLDTSYWDVRSQCCYVDTEDVLNRLGEGRERHHNGTWMSVIRS